MGDGITMVDDLDGDPEIPYGQRSIGDVWRSDAHVLIVLAGDEEGRDYAVAHPTGCDDDCIVTFQLYEGGCSQPSGYPPVPTDVGMYLMRAEMVKGGRVTADFAVDHDCYLVFDDLALEVSDE